MRVVARVAFLLVVAMSPAVAGPPEDPEMDYSSDDLVCHFGSWDGCDGWLAENRFAMVPQSRRATPVVPGAARKEDVPARTRAHDAIVAALSSNDVLVASEAALALGLAGEARDIPTLAAIVAKETTARRLRRWAALGLGALPLGDAGQAAEARKALLGALERSIGRKDRQTCFWANCAYAIAMRGDTAALMALVDLRKRIVVAGDDERRHHADPSGAMCYAIGALGGEDSLAEITSHLRTKRGAEGGVTDTSWAAVHALVRVGGANALKLLRETAKDDRPAVRCMALQGLGAVCGAKDEDSSKILRDALTGERDTACRQMAAFGLARSGHPSAGAALAAAWDHGSSPDRRFVIVALGVWLRGTPDPKLSALLAKSMEHESSIDERASLAVACGLAGVQAARASIADAIPKSRAGVVAPSACFALGLLGAGPAERKLLHEVVAQSVDATARLQAAVALGVLRDHEIVDRLRAILKSAKATEPDRASAAICLGHVGDDDDIEALLAALADGDTRDPLRACILHGLGRLLDRDEGAKLGRVVANGRWSSHTGLVEPFADLVGLME